MGIPGHRAGKLLRGHQGLSVKGGGWLELQDGGDCSFSGMTSPEGMTHFRAWLAWWKSVHAQTQYSACSETHRSLQWCHSTNAEGHIILELRPAFFFDQLHTSGHWRPLSSFPALCPGLPTIRWACYFYISCKWPIGYFIFKINMEICT